MRAALKVALSGRPRRDSCKGRRRLGRAKPQVTPPGTPTFSHKIAALYAVSTATTLGLRKSRASYSTTFNLIYKPRSDTDHYHSLQLAGEPRTPNGLNNLHQPRRLHDPPRALRDCRRNSTLPPSAYHHPLTSIPLTRVQLELHTHHATMRLITRSNTRASCPARATIERAMARGQCFRFLE